MPPRSTVERRTRPAVITSLGNIATRKATRLILVAVVVLTMAGMVFGFALPDAALAWNNCPKGLTNDPYPGACRRYVDTNGDGICDLSQSEPAASTTTSLPVSTTETTTSSTTKVTTAAGSLTTTTAASGEPPTGNCPLGPCIGCRACVSIAVDVQDGASIATSDAATTGAVTVALSSSDSNGNGTSGTSGDGAVVLADTSATNATATAADVSTQADATTSGGASLVTHYLVGPIAIGFFLIYGVSFLLYKLKKIRIATHRKIWNVMLLGTFLVTGIFGLILTVQLDYTLPFNIPINLLFWHVEAGIAMSLISLFHMGWHFKYYKNLVRNTRKKAREAQAAEREAWTAERGARRMPERGMVTAAAPVAVAPVTVAPRREPMANKALAAQAREERRVEREIRRERDEMDRARKQKTPPPVPRRWLEPGTD
jgi:hypothetical protein